MNIKGKAKTIRRVAILFAGGPAPAANAVISTAASAFLNNDVQVVGIMNGYSNLQEYSKQRPMQVGRDYIIIEPKTLRRTRNARGIILGTSRANPGKSVSHPSHLDVPERVAPLKRVYDALCSLDVDALVSVGGDDTLKTANKLKLFQERFPENVARIPIAHVPKTIDNDYMGIDFTFGYFTAVETLADEIRNLIHDAEATRSYFLTETMGRSAGWLAYGVAIAGEASYVISVEDIYGRLAATEEYIDSASGAPQTRQVMNVDMVVDQLVKMMLAREKQGKDFGVIVMAEGLAELLPMSYLEGIPRDEHGHISISHVNLGPMFARLMAEKYRQTTGKQRNVKGLQLGYEARCAQPRAFDVLLGSQLGVGAYRALAEESRNGVMVSVVGQLELRYVPFDELVDPDTLVTKVRFIERGSDFHRLARFLETNLNE